MRVELIRLGFFVDVGMSSLSAFSSTVLRFLLQTATGQRVKQIRVYFSLDMDRHVDYHCWILTSCISQTSM
jgi:hypothetical protein